MTNPNHNPADGNPAAVVRLADLLAEAELLAEADARRRALLAPDAPDRPPIDPSRAMDPVTFVEMHRDQPTPWGSA